MEILAVVLITALAKEIIESFYAVGRIRAAQPKNTFVCCLYYVAGIVGVAMFGSGALASALIGWFAFLVLLCLVGLGTLANNPNRFKSKRVGWDFFFWLFAIDAVWIGLIAAFWL